MAERIKALLVWAGLILVVTLFYGAGKAGPILAGVVAVLATLNVIFSKRGNLTKHTAGLLVFTLIFAFINTFYNAVQLGRPLTHTQSFFKYANVEYDREKLAYAENGCALFKIGLTTEEFEKLDKHYREKAQDSQRENDQYGWAYFELEPRIIDRDKFSDLEDSDEPFSSRLQKMETTDSILVESNEIQRSLQLLMEGFPEFDDELGRCRAIIWASHEVTSEFYWFEKQQKGYIRP